MKSVYAAVAAADVETILLAGINAPSAMNGQPWHFSVITEAAVMEKISRGMGGVGFGGGMPPAGTAPSEGSFPEGMEPPADMGEFPDDFEFPEEMGGKPFADGERPDGFAPPDGFAVPEGAAAMTPPANFGGEGGAAAAAKAGLGDSPLAIVVSCKRGSELDAGLACQNMSVTAQLLGYGTKIISSPTMALNGEKQDEYRELLGIPADQSAVAVLLIGYADTGVDENIDACTGATERNSMDAVVTYVSGKS